MVAFDGSYFLEGGLGILFLSEEGPEAEISALAMSESEEEISDSAGELEGFFLAAEFLNKGSVFLVALGEKFCFMVGAGGDFHLVSHSDGVDVF